MVFIRLILLIYISLMPLMAKETQPKEQSEAEQRLRMRARKMLIQGEGLRRNREASSMLSVICPNCKNNVVVINKEKSAITRGMDRDFCVHSRQKSNNDLDIWSCPNCGYSHHKSFFANGIDEPFSEDETNALTGTMIALQMEHLGMNISKLGYIMEQEDIPTIVKYKLMEKLLPKFDLDHKTLGDFYLNYAWCERRRLCSPISSPTLANTIGNINEQLLQYGEEENLDNIIANPIHVLAFLAHLKSTSRSKLMSFTITLFEIDQLARLGLNGAAINRAREAIQVDYPNELRSIAQFKHDRLIQETKQLKEATVFIKKAVRAEQYNYEELKSCIYLLGELQRRVGLYAESAAWFKAAQEFAPPQLQIWATEQLENLPKAQRDGLLPDSELLLVHKAKTSLKKLKPTQMALDPRSLQPAQVKRWMEEVSLATIQYRRTYKLDPESLEELHELNLLKGQPDLTKASLRFFQLKIDTKVNIASLRYTLNCIIPFSDQDGFYTIAYQKGKFHRHSSLN